MWVEALMENNRCLSNFGSSLTIYMEVRSKIQSRFVSVALPGIWALLNRSSALADSILRLERGSSGHRLVSSNKLEMMIWVYCHDNGSQRSTCRAWVSYIVVLEGWNLAAELAVKKEEAQILVLMWCCCFVVVLCLRIHQGGDFSAGKTAKR